jgi:RND family efflux transporter MFP subunit
MKPEETVRPTDYGTDIATHDETGVATSFHPDTGRRMKKMAVIVGAVLVAGFIGVRVDRFFKDRAVSGATEQSAAAHIPVDVIEAAPVAAAQRFTLPGQTSAWHASTIYARVNGFVGKWYSDIGDNVHKGQVLALIETPDLDAQLAAARAQLNAARAQVESRKAEAEFARTTYDRWRDSPKGVVSEQERAQKHADYDSAVAHLESAKADVALDQARVEQYLAMSQFKQVTAPFDGVITERHIDIGNLVTAGSTSATTPLYVLTQNNPMRVFVDVPQSAAADMTDLPAEVRPVNGTGEVYTAKVTRTSEALEQRSRTLRVEVDLDNAQQKLVPGMYVTVGFGLPPKGAVQIPAAALTFRAGGAQVARVDKNDRVTFQHVTIARDDGNVVELGSGVSPGDRLALNVSSQVMEGDQVQPKLVDTPASNPAAPSAQTVVPPASNPAAPSVPTVVRPASAAAPPSAQTVVRPASAASLSVSAAGDSLAPVAPVVPRSAAAVRQW